MCMYVRIFVNWESNQCEGDEKKNGHLKKLENAKERLHLFKADVLDYDALCAAFAGCTGVLHIASPVPDGHVHNPQVNPFFCMKHFSVTNSFKI